MSDIDGSHTPALRGGEEIAYQGRKSKKTTNALFLTDRNGLPLAMSTPVAGNHHDLYDTENRLEELFAGLEKAGTGRAYTSAGKTMRFCKRSSRRYGMNG